VLVAGHLFNFKVTQNMEAPSQSPAFFQPSSRVNPRQSVVSGAQELNRNAENQQSRFRRYACVATSVGGLVAGAGAYALASGVNNNNYDQADTYQVNLFNGLVGAGAAVGAAAVSWLVAKGVQAYCCVRDRTVEIHHRRAEGQVVDAPAPAADLEAQDFEQLEQQAVHSAEARSPIGIQLPAIDEYGDKLQQIVNEGQLVASAGEGVSAVTIHPSGKPA